LRSRAGSREIAGWWIPFRRQAGLRLIPNTADDGFIYFNRYYFAQQDRLGAVVDERFNEGGYIADYVVDLLARKLRGYFNNPVADHYPS
jgi:tricorn protease